MLENAAYYSWLIRLKKLLLYATILLVVYYSLSYIPDPLKKNFKSVKKTLIKKASFLGLQSANAFNSSQYTTMAKLINRDNSNCTENKWENLDLFLTYPPSQPSFEEISKLFFASLALFWPRQHLSMTLVTDSDAKGGEAFNDKLRLEIKKLFPTSKFNFAFNHPPYAFPRGFDRQQWIMLWADNFTNAEYVGFVDTDTVFVTRATMHDLYHDGKPIIRALYGKPYDSFWWPKVPLQTYKAIGKKEPFNCMTYFPVIIKTAHLKLMREHMRKQYKSATFDQAFFALMRKQDYSQFNLMCAYLWYYQQDSYYWTIGERQHNYPGPFAVGQAASLKEGGISKELFLRQQPHIAVHWTYEKYIKKPQAFENLMRAGICYSMPKDLPVNADRPSFCQKFPDRLTTMNKYEWTFEGYDITPWNESLALMAHKNRLKKIDVCLHEFDDQLLKNYL